MKIGAAGGGGGGVWSVTLGLGVEVERAEERAE